MRPRLLLAVLALIFAAPVLAQTVIPEGQTSDAFIYRDDAIVHRASGFAFPSSLGEMPRRKMKVYAVDDIAAYYTLYGGGNGDAWIDLYVYPALQPIEDEAAGIEAAIEDSVGESRISAPVNLPDGVADAAFGWFAGSLGNQDVSSGYILVRRGEWFIKVRATSPVAGGEDGFDRIEKAIADILWAWQP